MAKHAPPLRQNLLSLLLQRPWASRLIATLGIVLMTVGLYVPVVGQVGYLIYGDAFSRQFSRYSYTRAIWKPESGPLALLLPQPPPLLLLLGLDAIYALLALGGLGLIPLLWRPFSPKGAVAVRWTYVASLLLVTILAVTDCITLWQSMSQPLLRDVGQPPLPSSAPYILPGAVVFPLGVLLSGSALFRMLREPLPSAPPMPTPRTGWQRTATLVLTAGALVWCIGFYLMPEAVTPACSPVSFSVTQFAHGACAGLDSDQMLQAAYNGGLNLIAFVPYTLGRNYEFLVAAAGITAFGGWTHRLSVYTLAWLAIWPLLALGTALVALHGVDLIAQHGFHLTATSSNWQVGPGMVATFAGIGLVMLGQLSLWRELVRRNRPASVQENESDADPADSLRYHTW